MEISRLLTLIGLILTIAVSIYSQNDGEIQNNEELSQCKIRLKVEFLKTGKIGDVSLVSSNCDDLYLVNDAIEAAKKIEFEPKIENGKKVTVTKTVEFNFTVYDKKVGTNQTSDFENYGDVMIFARSYRPLKILYKPRPAYPKSDGGTICVQGTVNLRVQFLATGEIGEVKPVSELGYGLTEKAIEAARNMKFNPLIKNGIPTSVVKTVQFSFTIY